MEDSVKMNSTPKIQLVGCAKDEAAYLPEWIFYHLNLGFSSIKIYINNTTDNSVEVLDKIIKSHPEVSYVLADELISAPPAEYKDKTNEHFYTTNNIQAVIYTNALETKDEQSDYMLVLDIDEFFYPYKPLEDIFSVENNKNTLPLRFHWLLLSGDNEEFCSLAKCTKGFLDPSFKSAIPSKATAIRAEDPHRFSIHGDIGSINNDAIIFHRVLRSSKEYLYLLSRSTSDAKSKLANGFKKNRRGWTNKGKPLESFNIQLEQSYNTNFQQFINLCDIDTDIQIARNNITKKHSEIVESLHMINQQNIDLTRSLGGLHIRHVDLLKTALFLSFWQIIRLISPRLILSHESIKEAITSKLKGK